MHGRFLAGAADHTRPRTERCARLSLSGSARGLVRACAPPAAEGLSPHRAVPYEPSTQVRKVVGSRRNKARQHRSQAFIPNPETIRGAWRKTCLPVMTPRTMQACPRGCALCYAVLARFKFADRRVMGWLQPETHSA